MKILIADDHPLYREALRAQIERLFPHIAIEEMTSFDEVMHLSGASDAPYDLFLVDYHMPGMSIEALERLNRAFPKVPIAVISGTAIAADVRAVVQAGAKGFIPKTATGTHLMHALQLLLAGGTSVPADFIIADDLVRRTPDGAAPTAAGAVEPPAWLEALTGREREVLKGIANGLSNKEVGRGLGLAEVTVKLHLRSVFRKIGARNRSEAAVIATLAHL